MVVKVVIWWYLVVIKIFLKVVWMWIVLWWVVMLLIILWKIFVVKIILFLMVLIGRNCGLSVVGMIWNCWFCVICLMIVINWSLSILVWWYLVIILMVIVFKWLLEWVRKICWVNVNILCYWIVWLMFWFKWWVVLNCKWVIMVLLIV